MRYKLGRLLQLLGLLILPLAIAGNIARQDQIDLKRSLGMSAVGIGIFVIGWLIQQGARSQ
ncbi:MAG TPA: hypothetical protein VNK04_05900 [Gemmataceae bacterium]|nr:hypothetical protein [Gemmataceae bacterium]